MNKRIVKSVGAVAAGFVSVAALSVATDSVLESIGAFPPASNPGAYVAWMLAIALAYRSAYAVVGGYITARLSPQNPVRHVAALMVLGGIGGILGAVRGWGLGNHWYPVTLAVTGPLFVWLGGAWRTRNKKIE